MQKANNKSSSLWTDKHDAHCLEHKITASAKLLWQWLVYKGEGQELEPDLKEDFNKWVGKKRGKPFDPKTLKTAIKQLADCAVINILHRFSWKEYKIFLRPLEWLVPKKKSRNPEQISNLYPSNPELSEELDKQQQLTSSNHDLLQSEGFQFNTVEPEVLNRPENEIKLSVVMFKLRGGSKKIPNPEGWLRTCLRMRLWEEPRNYNRLLELFGATTTWDELFPTPDFNPNKQKTTASFWEELAQVSGRGHKS